jgi:alkylation response protein AidB-like acyl-CoA dehydrogenase
MNHASMSETARQVADSALKFGRDSGGVQRARATRDNAPSVNARVWSQIAELGWLGLRAAEEHGGMGMEVEVAAALFESAGKVLLPEPVVPAIAAAGLLSDCATEASLALLGQLMSGHWLCIPVRSAAHGEAQGDVRLAHVPDCRPDAQLLVASGAGATFALRHIELARVAASPALCVDGSTLSTLVVQGQVWRDADVIAGGAAAQAAFERAGDTMLLGYSAYLVGLMHEALLLTLDYMRVRSQFGSPIGAFQALQHRAASCHVDVLASRALLYEAARMFDTPARARAAAAAKARTSAAALRVTKECVQFHGAIGFADEHDIGLYLRKAMAIAARQGGQAHQTARYADLMREGTPG